jgi:hypothetical protein
MTHPWLLHPPLDQLSLSKAVSHITSEAAHHVITQHTHSSCPGPEYANATTTPSTSGMNSITGLHMHRHNLQGVFCTTPGCNTGDHDHTHCYGKGSGMEGQAPWMKHKKCEKDVAAADVIAPAATSTPAPSPTPAIAAAAIMSLTSLMDDMSLASIAEITDEVSCIANLPFTTILDSGTMLTLVEDCHYFHTYSTEDCMPVTTTNYGILQMNGQGACHHK